MAGNTSKQRTPIPCSPVVVLTSTCFANIRTPDQWVTWKFVIRSLTLVPSLHLYPGGGLLPSPCGGGGHLHLSLKPHPGPPLTSLITQGPWLLVQIPLLLYIFKTHSLFVCLFNVVLTPHSGFSLYTFIFIHIYIFISHSLFVCLFTVVLTPHSGFPQPICVTEGSSFLLLFA